VRPLGIFGGGRAFWVQDEEGIENALSDKGSAYGPFGAPYIVAVASSSITTDDHDVRNALYGTEAILINTAPGGETHSDDLARSPDGYSRAATGATVTYRRYSSSSNSTPPSWAPSGTPSGSTPTLSGPHPRSRCGGDRRSTPRVHCTS